MVKGGNAYKGKTAKSSSLAGEEPKGAVSLIPKNIGGQPYISFSFRYCTQQEWFGIAGQDAAWFASLQDRLKDLSGKTGAILEDGKIREDYRLHPIDWNATNCPIKKEDLTSVPKVIIDNAEPDFFWQFQISKGTGRVVGFFNEDNSVFYIVLLDPKHNIQPSKDYGYHVDPTSVAITEYERVQMVIAEAEKQRNTCKNISECPLGVLHEEYMKPDNLYASIDKDLKDTFKDLIEKGTFQKEFEDFLAEKYFESD